MGSEDYLHGGPESEFRIYNLIHFEGAKLYPFLFNEMQRHFRAFFSKAVGTHAKLMQRM